MKQRTVHVLFSPLEYASLPARDLSRTTCVVFDVLRATSSMVTALHHGAAGIIPVAEISDALDLHNQRPELLLAGERHGLRITREITGHVDFDLGNSPREFTPDKVKGRTIVTTTTNGTRALRACSHAGVVLLGALLNLGALTAAVAESPHGEVLLICAGTGDDTAYEDTLAAGALCDRLQRQGGHGLTDSAMMALRVFQQERADLEAGIARGSNGRRLLALAALAADVAVCARVDAMPIHARMEAGIVQVTSRSTR